MADAEPTITPPINTGATSLSVWPWNITLKPAHINAIVSTAAPIPYKAIERFYIKSLTLINTTSS